MNSGTGRGSSLAGSAGGAGGLCASPGTPGRGAPCPRFRTASLKKSSGAPGRQARSIKAAGAQRRKGPVCIPQTQKPLSRHSGRGGGGEGAESALEQCGQSGRGRPVGTKGPQCWRGGRPGPGGSIKGSCVPAALCPQDSPDKNTRVGCHAFLQEIFPTQGMNLCLLWLLHCKDILFQ